MNQIIKYYDEACKNAEFGWQASCWASENDQYGRFVVASSSLTENCSVLDVGCGQGDYYKFIKQRYKNINYLGIDISEEMIKSAKIKNPNGNFEKIDVLESNLEADYVFALGTFNLKTKDQLSYIKKYIEKCYESCKKRLCVCLTSELAEEKCSDIYFYNPQYIFDIAISLSSRVIINTASITDEIVLHIIKS